MNRLLLAVAALLALASIVSASINCYVGAAGTYITTPGFDVCYTWTLNGALWKAGDIGVTCSSAPSGYSCCSTNLCNGAKINGMSILMASVAAMVALFRDM